HGVRLNRNRAASARCLRRTHRAAPAEAWLSHLGAAVGYRAFPGPWEAGRLPAEIRASSLQCIGGLASLRQCVRARWYLCLETRSCTAPDVPGSPATHAAVRISTTHPGTGTVATGFLHRGRC